MNSSRGEGEKKKNIHDRELQKVRIEENLYGNLRKKRENRRERRGRDGMRHKTDWLFFRHPHVDDSGDDDGDHHLPHLSWGKKESEREDEGEDEGEEEDEDDDARVGKMRGEKGRREKRVIASFFLSFLCGDFWTLPTLLFFSLICSTTPASTALRHHHHHHPDSLIHNKRKNWDEGERMRTKLCNPSHDRRGRPRERERERRGVKREEWDSSFSFYFLYFLVWFIFSYFSPFSSCNEKNWSLSPPSSPSSLSLSSSFFHPSSIHSLSQLMLMPTGKKEEKTEKML